MPIATKSIMVTHWKLLKCPSNRMDIQYIPTRKYYEILIVHKVHQYSNTDESSKNYISMTPFMLYHCVTYDGGHSKSLAY